MPSASELELFGGQLVYDTSWAQYEQGRYRMGLRTMVARMPGLVAMAVRLAWRADRRATVTVGVAELVRSVCQAVTLLGINWLLFTLLGDGELTDRMREALPIAAFLACTAGLSALCEAASVRAAGPLEPRVERLASDAPLKNAGRCMVQGRAPSRAGVQCRPPAAPSNQPQGGEPDLRSPEAHSHARPHLTENSTCLQNRCSSLLPVHLPRMP